MKQNRSFAVLVFVDILEIGAAMAHARGRVGDIHRAMEESL